MGNLSEARQLAALVRVSEDEVTPNGDFDGIKERAAHKDRMLRSGVLISQAVTPSLDDIVSTVCKNLLVPRSAVSAFVYSNPDVQADCLIDTPDTCVLRLTSGLVNLMEPAELKFVIGHEIGHFLLGHGVCSQYLAEGSSEDFIVRRARELSSDRLGYLSVGDQEQSIRAIIKTASGLDSSFLRFDVASFLSQTSMLSNPKRGEAYNSSHPSLLMRCRSLLWFMMSVEDRNSITRDKMKKVDDRVIADLRKFVDGEIRLKRNDYEREIAIWKTALLSFHSGAFTLEIQNKFCEYIDEISLSSIKSFFELYSKEELEHQLNDRLQQSINNLYKEFPSSANQIEEKAFSLAYKIVEN